MNIKMLLDKLSLPNIDDCVLRVMRSLSPAMKWGFCSALIFALLTHGYFFLNKFVNEDSMLVGINAHDWDGHILGRWLRTFVISIRGYYVAPWLIGIITLICIALAVMLIVSLLEIHRKSFVIISAFLVVTFPSLAYSFAYDWISESYTLALLLAVIAIYLTNKFKHGYALGALSLMLSLALYQSYLGFAIGLSLILVIKTILDDTKRPKDVVFCALRFMLCGVIGIIAYLVSVHLFVALYNSSLSTYMGANTMGRIPLDMLPFLLRRSFVNFFKFFYPSGQFFHVSWLLFICYTIAFLLGGYLGIHVIFSQKMYKQITKFLLLILCVALLPFGLNIIDLIAPESFTSNLNTHQFALVFILIFILDETRLTVDKKKDILAQWVLVSVVFLIAGHYLVASGHYYLKMHIYYERTYAYYNRVLSRIEETPGYLEGYPVAFFTRPVGLHFESQPEVQFDKIYYDVGLVNPIVGIHEPIKIRRFISDYLGVGLELASAIQLTEVQNHKHFIAMPIYPEIGSVAVINGVIVVKFF